MSPPKTAPYGSWLSPITSDLIVAQSIALAEVRLDGEHVYWLEGRPQEQGRMVVVRANWLGGEATEMTPRSYSARTRVHEYGGGAWTVSRGVVIFSNFNDGRLYRVSEAAREPQALTPSPPARERQWRYADGIIDHPRQRWIGVREDHTVDGEPVNAIVAVGLEAAEPEAGLVLVEGHDFLAAPRLSPDGHHLLWLAWDHPNMPWNGTTLYLAALDPAGRAAQVQAIAGGPAESIFQPEWSPDGSTIYFVSDRSNWWNLYGFDLATRSTQPLAPMAAEFGLPQWNFGMSTYACVGSDRIVCAYYAAGLGRLATLDLTKKTLAPIATPFTEFGSVQADGERIAFRAGAPDHPASIVALDKIAGPPRVLKKSTGLLDQSEPRIADWLTSAEPVEFPTTGGNTAFGLFYPPRNPRFAAPAGEKPPLLVKCHGGPTSAASSALNLTTQFWTSRGIAVLDVNYGGSTGFGRAYRER
ncbi:MAG TPA: S9 family peptidase, partial [Xanthobacteraceae bacterium]|nr:S9 family peptidase [Xanthobacteraceae bacterium]